MQVSRAVTAAVMKTEILYAGFWRRVLAYLIDSALLVGVEFILFSSVYVLAPGNLDALGNVAPVCVAIGWAYYVLFESSPARGTPGKLAVGLYVADVHGDPISFWRAVLRNALKTLSTLLCFAGWVMASFTPRKQTLHDLLAGTLVLRNAHYFVIGPEAPTEPGDHWDGTSWVASVPPLERS
jgi:uncharacterized RDD family membrane protein YckC